MSVAQSEIYICEGVNLTPAYEHTIHFDNPSAQSTFFAGKVVRTFSAYSYLRKSWAIKVDATMYEAKGWNYLYFRNPVTPYDGIYDRYYYYFITNIEYLNDNTVELSLEMDVMQTYMFDYELLPSFVEREHTNDDTVGVNVIPENLDVGEYVDYDTYDVDMGDMCVLIMSTFDPVNTTGGDNIIKVESTAYNSIFGGMAIHMVKKPDFNTLGKKLKEFDEWGLSDGIVSMWMYPEKLVNVERNQNEEGESIFWRLNTAGIEPFSVEVFPPTSVGIRGIHRTPRNNKLLTYPYSFLYITNNNGSSAVYHYEKFHSSEENNAIYLNVSGAISPEGSAYIYPYSYDANASTFEYGLTLPGFPSCAWNTDTYKLWLAQNQTSLNVSGGQALLSVAGGIGSAVVGIAAAATGVGALAGGVGIASGVGMIGSGLSQISSLLAQNADKSIEPPQSKGAHSSSVNITEGFQTFSIKRRCVTKATSLIIDDYFDRYGYKTLRVKVPNTKVRENWTYTKTVGCTISGNICTSDKNKIEGIYNNGITFWVDGDSVGKYNLSNNVI